MKQRNFNARVRRLEQATGIGKPRGRVTINILNEDGTIEHTSTGEPGPFRDTVINIVPAGPADIPETFNLS